MIEVSICVLTWNSTKLLKDNLDAIFQCIKDINLEVIVVDNGSADNVAEVLRQRFPQVELIQNKINKGIAAARNQCIVRAKGLFILFLDSDVCFNGNFLKPLICKLKNDSDAAIAAPRIVYPNGNLQFSCRRYPRLLALVFRGLKLNRVGLLPKNKFLINYLMLDADFQKTQEVDWVLGACQLIRRKALNEVGVFDEAYFFGYEDIDLCRRLKSRGWKILYIPESEIIHHYQRRSAYGINRFTFLHLRSIAYYFIKYNREKIFYKSLKRIFDIFLSFIGIVIFFPFFLLISSFIRSGSKGRVIFKQVRVGQYGRKFTIYKLRTMQERVNMYMRKPDKDFSQITKTGRFLRKTGLDEMPQILNVLKGEMSLVGPRPEMPFIVREYSRLQRQRLNLKPGITGLWQLSGKTEEPIHEKLDYDLTYLKNRSLFLDIRILLNTIMMLLESIMLHLKKQKHG